MLVTILIKLLILALFGMLAKWGFSGDCRYYRSGSAAFALVVLIVMMLLGNPL